MLAASVDDERAALDAARAVKRNEQRRDAVGSHVPQSDPKRGEKPTPETVNKFGIPV
jgi:hypothetical protein